MVRKLLTPYNKYKTEVKETFRVKKTLPKLNIT